MEPSWWWRWRFPFRYIYLFVLLFLSVFSGFLVSRSECPKISEVLHAPQLSAATGGEGQPQDPRALPTTAGPGTLPPSGSASSPLREDSGAPLALGKGPGRRSLLATLPDKHDDTAVVAFLDGTIYLVDSNSGKFYGSFSSGSPLATSFQAFPDHVADTESVSSLCEQHGTKSRHGSDYFIYCGDDWNLYEHDEQYGERRLEMSIEEYIKSTPIISTDGGVTLGSKRSTVFLVDAKTGKVISPYWPADNQGEAGVGSREGKVALSKLHTRNWVEFSPAVIPPLLITRTDYILNHFTNSSKVLWGMTVSVIEAFSCKSFRSGLSLATGYKLGLEYQGALQQCNITVPVYPIHDSDPISKNLVPSRRFILPETINKDELPSQQPPLLPASPTENHVDRQLPPLEPWDHLSGMKQVQKLPSAQNSSVLGMIDEGQTSLSLPQKPLEVNNPSRGSFDANQNVSLVPAVKPDFMYGSSAWYLFLFFLLLSLLIILKLRNRVKSDKQSDDLVGKQSAVIKKRKARKVGNTNGSIKKNGIHSLPKYEKVQINEFIQDQINEADVLMDLMGVVESGDGRWIGKLLLSNKEIAKGSNGTVILEGVYGGRSVAVKRLVRAHHDVAFKEIQNLIASDRHPNIVRWFGVEYDLDFVYLSLERCTCSLNDLIQLFSDSSVQPRITENCSSNFVNEYKVSLDSLKGMSKDIDLWKSNGCPSPQLLKLMRDVVSGLAHMHDLGIVHRDIKPQNVLISTERSLSAKLSDMGISKRLPKDMSSLGHHATGHGSSGWQAPEQLLHGRQTRAVDLFSLGCVLFFCITKGKHPFGSYFERDSNILNNRVDLFLVEHIPEAVHLFSHLLDPIPELRPKAVEVLQHPFFWSSELRLSFLRDVSDRIELEDREKESELSKALESSAPVAFGGRWGEKLDAPFVTDMGRYRKYRFDCTRDLLRVIRNKLNHYQELSKELQELLGSVPQGFDDYFTRRFPKLLIEVYKVMYRYCREDDCFRKYFKSSVV